MIFKDIVRCSRIAYYRRLTLSRKGLLIRIPMVTELVGYFGPDKIDQTLPGFEPRTPRTWRKLLTTVLNFLFF